MAYNSGYTGAEIDASVPVINAETIAAGVITISDDADGIYSVATESAAATDDLDQIAGGMSAGRRITLYPYDDGDTVVVKHDVAKLALNDGQDFTMNNALDTITFLSKGSNIFAEMSRSSNGD